MQTTTEPATDNTTEPHDYKQVARKIRNMFLGSIITVIVLLGAGSLPFAIASILHQAGIQISITDTNK